MPPIRVIIAEDEPSYREALASLIRSDPSLDLAGVAEDGDAAINLVQAEQPDVALLDTKMPFADGPKATRTIRACSPRTRVLALSAHGDRQSVLDMLRAGALGYLVKEASGEEITAAIRHAASGQAVLSKEVTAAVISELVTHLENSEKLAQELEDLDQHKRELVQILSHELLTPVTVIQGTAQTLATHGAELTHASIGALVSGLLRACHRIRRLAGNVTTAALLARGGTQIQVRPTPTTNLLREAAAQFSDDHRLHLPSDVRESLVMWADMELAVHALVAVIENALGFSPPHDPVDIQVQADHRTVRILVSDRGPGIPPTLHDKLFQPFSPGDASTTRTQGGLGIGLYLAKRVMLAHQGEIKANPRGGSGSTLILTFRRYVPDTDARADASSAEDADKATTSAT